MPLRYALIRLEDVSTLLLEGVTTYDTMEQAEDRSNSDHLLVFDGDDIVFTADLLPFWNHWMGMNGYRSFDVWCRLIERWVGHHIRKGLTLPNEVRPNLLRRLDANEDSCDPSNSFLSSHRGGYVWRSYPNSNQRPARTTHNYP